MFSPALRNISHRPWRDIGLLKYQPADLPICNTAGDIKLFYYYKIVSFHYLQAYNEYSKEISQKHKITNSTVNYTNDATTDFDYKFKVYGILVGRQAYLMF